MRPFLHTFGVFGLSFHDKILWGLAFLVCGSTDMQCSIPLQIRNVNFMCLSYLHNISTDRTFPWFSGIVSSTLCILPTQTNYMRPENSFVVWHLICHGVISVLSSVWMNSPCRPNFSTPGRSPIYENKNSFFLCLQRYKFLLDYLSL